MSATKRRPRTPAMLAGKPLSPREREVLALIRRGKTLAEVAAELGITHRTATLHCTSLRWKAQVKHKRELIEWREP